MALKPDRDFFAQDDITHFWVPGTIADTSVTTKGGVASLVTPTTGAGMDDTSGPSLEPVKLGKLATSGIRPGTGSSNTVDYLASPSGAVARGMLLQDVINEDGIGFNEPRRRPMDGQNVSFPGRKVTLVRRGWLVTDKITGSPVAGDTAYLAANGNVSPTQSAGAPAVGKFETAKDTNGFAKVFMDL